MLHHLRPRDLMMKAGAQLDGPMKVREVAAPDPTNFNVLLIDLVVRVNLAGSVVGIVPADNDLPAVSDEIKGLLHGLRAPGRLDDDVYPKALGPLFDEASSLFRGC